MPSKKSRTVLPAKVLALNPRSLSLPRAYKAEPLAGSLHNSSFETTRGSKIRRFTGA